MNRSAQLRSKTSVLLIVLHRFIASPRLAATLAVIALPFSVSSAQRSSGGIITGTVRDSARAPIRNADVVANPGEYRAQSDSAGGFRIAGLPDGAYVVTARAPGHRKERWDVSLRRSGRVTLNFILGPARDSLLVDKRDCALLSFDGFECRRRLANGVFLDRGDIEERAVVYAADLFRDIPGFRVERVGARTVASLNRRSACLSSLIDGRPATTGNPPPAMAVDVTAIEVYLESDSVPLPYRRFSWPSGNVARRGRCVVVVYWTVSAG